MKLWLYEDDTVEQFLDDLVLVGLVLLGNLRTLHIGLFVNGSLDSLDAPSMLNRTRVRLQIGERSRGDAPMPRKP